MLKKVALAVSSWVINTRLGRAKCPLLPFKSSSTKPWIAFQHPYKRSSPQMEAYNMDFSRPWYLRRHCSSLPTSITEATGLRGISRGDTTRSSSFNPTNSLLVTIFESVMMIRISHPSAIAFKSCPATILGTASGIRRISRGTFTFWTTPLLLPCRVTPPQILPIHSLRRPQSQPRQPQRRFPHLRLHHRLPPFYLVKEITNSAMIAPDSAFRSLTLVLSRLKSDVSPGPRSRTVKKCNCSITDRLLQHRAATAATSSSGFKSRIHEWRNSSVHLQVRNRRLHQRRMP